MNFLTLTLIALGLSADAFAVSISNGMCVGELNKRHTIVTATTFGVFQSIMPIIGFVLGTTFSDIILKYQHWVALILLGSIGINMIVEYFKERKNPMDCSAKNLFSFKNLILQGIATSIDALAVGVSFVALSANIIPSATYIGVITFFICAFGVVMGNKFGSKIGIKAKFIGGFILATIGLRIFLSQQFNFL